MLTLPEYQMLKDLVIEGRLTDSRTDTHNLRYLVGYEDGIISDYEIIQ